MNKSMLVLLALATLTFAADRPDFSGVWKMDAAQSEFGGAPPPDAFTRTIEQNSSALTMTDEQTSSGGNDKVVRKYPADGTEITYQWMGNEVKSAAHWEGDTLVIVGKVNANGTDLVVTSHLTLSGDGQTLTENDRISAGGSDVGTFKLVLRKQ